MEEANALVIIRHLADGIDPHTGEVFPVDSPYNQPDTIHALLKAIESLSYQSGRRERQKQLPARAGKPWDQTESDQLARSYDAGISIPDLAKEHQRTNGAIESQLAKLGKVSQPVK